MWTLIIIALLTGQASSTGANGARSGASTAIASLDFKDQNYAEIHDVGQKDHHGFCQRTRRRLHPMWRRPVIPRQMHAGQLVVFGSSHYARYCASACSQPPMMRARTSRSVGHSFGKV